jgi:hypothetical protein
MQHIGLVNGQDAIGVRRIVASTIHPWRSCSWLRFHATNLSDLLINASRSGIGRNNTVLAFVHGLG